MKLPPFPLFAALAAFALVPFSGCASDAAPAKHTFEIKGADFTLDGKPVVLRSGEMHYPRTPHQYWRDRLKKAKAMGLNAVCTYIFWNVHEPKRGEWTWEGDADIVEFCKIAQEEGLFVIVRPGPYVCTEWDFGGFPAWLLADRTTQVRSLDPKYAKPTREYILKVGEKLRDLQVTRGGPIIMVQVENEYGSFGDDAAYKQANLDWLKEAGFEVPFFTSDGPSQGMLKGGTLPGITPTLNFGSGAKKAFEELEKFRPGSPRMNGEFWVGWFDAWGKKHIATSAEAKAKDFAWMIENDISVNIYMFHGGTNFGFMAGSNGNRKSDYTVDITSYDYSAVLDEAGRPTRKYDLMREVLLKKFPTEKFPETPASRPLQALPAIALTASAPFEGLLGAPVRAEKPATMEELGQSYGFTLYRTTVTGPAKGKLDLGHVRDRAIVTLDGVRVGALDRRLNQHELALDVPAGEHRLELLVENLSRVNFGRDMVYESKGLVEPVKFAGKELAGWAQYPVPCDNLSALKFGARDNAAAAASPRFLRGEFTPTSDADTYLDMSKWGKGVVWVNGRNLGRFWNIGPQQALYLPGCWLKPGAKNELVVLALEGDTPAGVSGVPEQIWDTRVDPALYLRKPGQNLALDASDVVHAGKFAPGEDWQTVKFAKNAKGRHLAFEALNALDGKAFAAMTEIVFLDAAGRDIPREECSVVYADSEELKSENGSAALVLDNQPTTWWHTGWSEKAGENPGFPHALVFDLGADREVSGFRYQPRRGATSGRIGDYRVYLRTQPFAGL